MLAHSNSRPLPLRLRPPITALVLLAALAPGSIHTPAAAQSRSDIIRERIKTRPDDPTLHYYLATAECAAGNRTAGLEALQRVAELGVGFLPARDVGFDSLWNDPDFKQVYQKLERKLPKVTAARELFRLDKQLIPEGIAYDARSRSYFVGSVAQSKIVRVDAAGKVSDFSRPGEMRQVLGLAVDSSRRLLHAVSTTLVEGAPDSGRNAIVTYDLSTGALVRKAEVSAAAQLNDVTVDSRGHLYTTDSRSGAVFRIHRESGRVDTLAAPGRLPGVNGIAVAAGDSVLYLGHSTGVARMVIATGDILPRIELPRGETVAAIDGLYVDGHTLLGVQNVTNPGRVIRIHLRADGRGAERVETLLSHHHPAIDEPTTGVVVGRTFALLATTQVTRFQPNGALREPGTLVPAAVLQLSLEARK